MESDASARRAGYIIPRYRAQRAVLYHVLHGTVPGHQIDFMYCPEVPQGALRQTHLGHLARLIKYIEPRESSDYAFAIGNLSRDDVQHEPGHGGISVLFALRAHGVVDHAGRSMPPYAHAVVGVDRHFDYMTLLELSTALYRRFLEREGACDQRGAFYRSYVELMRQSPDDVPRFLAQAISEHTDLPAPKESALGWDYATCDPAPPRQIAIVYDEPIDFGTLAHWASVLASLLYRSNIKWTSVSTGREIEIRGGTAIRFVPRAEAGDGLCASSFEICDLPDDEDELMRLLFNAKRHGVRQKTEKSRWREAISRKLTAPLSDLPPGEEVDDAATTLAFAGQAREKQFVGRADSGSPPIVDVACEPGRESPRPSEQSPLRSHSKGTWLIVGAVLAAAFVVLVVAIAVGGRDGREEPLITAGGSFENGTTTAPKSDTKGTPPHPESTVKAGDSAAATPVPEVTGSIQVGSPAPQSAATRVPSRSKPVVSAPGRAPQKPKQPKETGVPKGKAYMPLEL